jgi:hypothetical protein
VKKLLLTGIAALLMAASAAHAVAAKLPEEMIGKWCFDKSTSTEDKEYYSSVEDVSACGNHGGLIIRKEGYTRDRFGPQVLCKFKAIKLSRKAEPTPDGTDEPTDIYLVRANCKKRSGGNPWSEVFEIQQGEGTLIIWPLPEG